MAATTIGILGGGFAGLYFVSAAQKMLGPGVDITLFDRNNFFLYTPVLHEMATGTVDARHVVVPLRTVIDPRRIRIRNEEARAVDLAERSLETASGRFRFDFLVLCPGSEANFYGIPGAEENSVAFKTVGDAIRLRNFIISVLEKAALVSGPQREQLLTINMVGAGCTGVEVISETAQFVKLILKRSYPEIARDEVRLNLIEAAPQILSSFPEYLRQVAAQRLGSMGIRVLVNSRIRSVTEDRLEMTDGRTIPKGILIWAAGIRARNIETRPLVERDATNRIIVNDCLEIAGCPGVFAIGDGALLVEDGEPLPPTASVAFQQGKYLARQIRGRLAGKRIPPFRFVYRGDMASLGFMSGVCEVYGWKFKGFIAWMIWKLFKLAMMPRYKNRFQILADWLITFIFKRDTSNLASASSP